MSVDAERILFEAEATLVEAARAITDAHVESAKQKARELFDNAPWLAKTESEIGGCMHIRYCDLYALLVQADGLPNSAVK